jgi:hypothetical protein
MTLGAHVSAVDNTARASSFLIYAELTNVFIYKKTLEKYF